MRIRRHQWKLKISRDTVLFMAGLAGIANEAVLRHGNERPYLLVIFSAMLGLPLFFRNDERSGKGGPQ